MDERKSVALILPVNLVIAPRDRRVRVRKFTRLKFSLPAAPRKLESPRGNYLVVSSGNSNSDGDDNNGSGPNGRPAISTDDSTDYKGSAFAIRRHRVAVRGLMGDRRKCSIDPRRKQRHYAPKL